MRFYADDNCDYTDSLRNHYAGNWAQNWVAANPSSILTSIAGTMCGGCCAHSQGLNCVLKGGAFWWLLSRLAGWNGTAGTDASDTRPLEARLQQNFPNPFNPATVISYELRVRGSVVLSIFTMLGQKVATLVNGPQEPGMHEVRFDASGLSSGMYFYRLQTRAEVTTKSMVVLK
jgi:hypothetical protein